MHDSDVVAFELPGLVVWHREPGGYDSGEVCKHYIRKGTHNIRLISGWRLHVHHWRLQFPPLQRTRRRLLTRCAWCGGRHSRTDPVNHAHQWDAPKSRWWKGEPGLFHGDCSAISTARRACLCETPVLRYGDYGQCAVCGNSRAFGLSQAALDGYRILAAVPRGERDPEAYRRVCDLHEAGRS